MLLEDGIPLPFPNISDWDDIAAKGKGRYYIDTATRMFCFSASDNSDPRTNGRKYEVISPYPLSPLVEYFILLAALSR